MTVTMLRPYSCPDASLVLPADAPRHRWLAERRKGIGGSDASTVAGVNAYSSLYALWLDKTGRLEDKTQSARMRWGHLHEPALRQAFTEDTGITVRRAGLMASKERPWQRVSVDGLTEDGGLFESKTTNWRMAGEWDDDQVADHAEVQVQHGLAVTGRPHAWVVALIDGWDFQIRRVERDEELIRVITELEEDFWANHVLADEPPTDYIGALPAVKSRWAQLTKQEMTVVEPADVEPLHRDLLAAKAATKAAAEHEAALEAELRDLIADGGSVVAGGKVYATCAQNGTFSLSRFREDHPDLAADLTTKPAFDLDRLKAEHPDLYTTYRGRVLRLLKNPKEL